MSWSICFDISLDTCLLDQDRNTDGRQQKTPRRLLLVTLDRLVPLIWICHLTTVSFGYSLIALFYFKVQVFYVCKHAHSKVQRAPQALTQMMISIPQTSLSCSPHCIHSVYMNESPSPGTTNLYGTFFFATALITNAGELHPSGSSVGYPSPIRIGVLLLSPSAVALKVA